MESTNSPGSTFSPEDQFKSSVINEHLLHCTQSVVVVLSLYEQSSSSGMN